MSTDPALPGQPYPLVADERRNLALLITEPWYNALVRIANDVVALGPSSSSATITGWGTSAGGTRAPVNGSFSEVAGAGYSQHDTQVLINQVEALSKALAQLLTDLKTFGILGG